MPLTRRDRSLGFGQVPQNLTASRALGVNYTNNTGKPLFVNIHASGTVSIYPWINGIAQAPIGNAGSGSMTMCQVSYIVPVDAVYAFSTSNTVLSASGLSLIGWGELRVN